MFTLTDRNGRNVIFKVLLYTGMGIFIFSVLYPLYYLLMYSFSTYGGLAGDHNPFMLVPAGFTLEAYKTLLSHEYIRNGYLITIFRSVTGPVLTVLCTAITAYPLAKKDLPGRKAFTWFLMINMFFAGGLIPTYLIIRDVGLVDNIWVLVVPGMFSTYYILLLRTFYTDLPDALEEAAEIDGASVMQIFFRIVLPITVPSLMTIGCWSFFGHWNSWFDSILYIPTLEKRVVQAHIQQLVIDQSSMLMSGGHIAGGKANQPTEESVRAAGIMITVIPVLIIYPFVRRYFTKGMVLGSVKG